MKLSKRQLKEELEEAFRLYEEKQVERSRIIIELTTSEDDFMSVLSDRFQKKRTIRTAVFKQIMRLIDKE